MTFPKTQRVVNAKAIKAVRARDPYCQVCGGVRQHIHHVKSRGAGGDDDPANLIGLCSGCHGRVHTGELANEQLRRILAEKYGCQGGR